jgi:hypothetical protein
MCGGGVDGGGGAADLIVLSQGMPVSAVVWHQGA